MSNHSIKPGTELKGWQSLIHGSETEETTPHLPEGLPPEELLSSVEESQFTRDNPASRHVLEGNPPVTRGVYRPKK